MSSTCDKKSDVPTSVYVRHQSLTDEPAFSNRVPILEVMTQYLSVANAGAAETDDKETTATLETLSMLEVASGSGQQAAFFSEQISRIGHILPTEYDRVMLSRIEEVTKDQRAKGKVLPPMELDVCNPLSWENVLQGHAEYLTSTKSLVTSKSADGTGRFGAALVVNLCHITPWSNTEDLLNGMSGALLPGAYFFLYGPFKKNNQFTTESNEKFDIFLKGKDSRFGLRDIDAVAAVCPRWLRLEKLFEMPENNFLLVFRRTTAEGESAGQ